ncbi:ABC transporter ATP-binding protein [Castellaniella sp.]|uniref:ABC transporter ATP-binding protein n=1 Tax=Castellaniella sp. TaxID=1955812 RepID=UPI00355E84A5
MLTIRNLRLDLGGRTILHDLSAEPLAGGQLIAVLGPNGSGKTSLLRALAGQVRATQGAGAQVRHEPQGVEVERPHDLRGVGEHRPHELMGAGEQQLHELTGAKAQRPHEPQHAVDLLRLGAEARARLVAYLPQDLPPAVSLRALEALLVADWQRGRLHGRAASLRAAQAVLARLGLGDLALRALDTLSGGQRQLVGLAQVLVREVPIQLLDEPLSALDLRHQAQVMQLLAAETRERGCLTLIVLHDLNVALQYTQGCLLLQAGRLVAQGAPEAVLTPDTLARVWGVRARTERCSRGIPRVLVDGPLV